MSEILDNINLKKADAENMLEHIEKFPEECLKAWDQMRDFAPPSFYIKPNKFVILGMGGSGVAGDIIKDLLHKNNALVEVIHDYEVPGWVDKDTLVIANSYSGNTEETLNAFLMAKEKGAKLIVVTTGGKLKVLAEKLKVPCIEFHYDAKPRAAIAYLFVALLVIFNKIGRLDLSDTDFKNSIETLNEYASKYKISNRTSSNPAKTLANKIYDLTPVIYSSGNLSSSGKRFKEQLNENAKNFAFHEVFPELNHNDLEGYHHPKHEVIILILESNYDFARIVKRQNITAEILRKNKVRFERIKFLPCDSPLSEILIAILFGDYVSFYLAMLNNEDPSSIKNINYLKTELSK